MKASVSTLYRILEEWWQTIQQRGIPGAMLRDQLPSGAIPPATSTDKGGVLLSDTAPNATGTAAAGTGSSVSRTDHVHPLGAHDHTATAGDGGTLTNDTHDGYSEYAEIASPSTPASNKVRLYAKDSAGVSNLYFKGDDGTEHDLAAGGSSAPVGATYITQTSDATLTNEQALASLSTGLVKVTTTTGVLSTATAADLPSHDHTGASDGGVLTNDAHDGYSDYTEIAAPSTPAANTARLYSKDVAGVTEFFYKNSAGTERDLSAAGGSMTNPMTTEGDLIYGGASGTPTRVAVGASGKVLTSNGTDPVWGDGPLTTRGDIITGGVSGAIQRLAIGAANTVLHGSATDPAYSAVVEADLNLTDLTTADVSTTKHGFAPKAPNDTTKFLNGAGAYTVPAGTATYPTVATIWHDQDVATAGAAIVNLHDSAQNYAAYTNQGTGADGDAFSQDFFIAAGTYTFSVLGITASTKPKVDWAIDGSNIATGQDWYTAGLTYNVLKTTASVVIATGGVHTLRGTVNGKNASSGGYQLNLTKMWFR